MKKSEIYNKAANAVVLSEDISAEDKLEILKELFGKEEIERFIEDKAEREARDNAELR